MSNNLRTRNGMPFNFVNGLKVRGMDIESLIPGIEGIPEAGSKYQFAGNGTNKSFTLPVSPYNKDAVDVYVKQLYVHPDDYTLVGDTITLVEAPPAVVVGETYNVVIKVSLTTLNGYVNANRVSFEGENLDDILEKGKPLANYSNLRAYAGAATQVRITDPGIAGFFYYDASDTTSTDNGGTIIVSSNGKRWKRLFDGAVNVKWFGADPTGVSDSTAAIQNAYNFLAANRVNAVGIGKLTIPRGRYLCNGTVTLTSAIGLIVEGEGAKATQLYRTVDTGNLFAIGTYIYIEFANLGIYHTTTSNRIDWATNCFRLSGVGGGREFCLRRIETDKFNRIISFEGSGGNEDTNYFEGCTFSQFKTFLYCRNSQAVINKTVQCTWFGNVDRVFDISGFGCTHIDTSNIVQSGTFIYLANGISGPSSQYTVTNAKFEFWNGVTSNNTLGTTKIVEIENNAANTVYIKFVNSNIAGGTPDPNTYQWDLQGGVYTLEVNGGNWTNTKIQTMSRTVNGGHNAWWVVFRNLQSPPSATISRLSTGQNGACHVPVVFESCRGMENINLRGPGGTFTGNGKIAGIALDRNRNTKNSNGALVVSSTTVTHTFSTYGQLVLVDRIRVVVTRAGGWQGPEIKAFADSALTVQIGATITPTGGTFNSPTAYVYEVAVPAGTFTTEGVYVTVKNTNANGAAEGLIYVDTLSV